MLSRPDPFTFKPILWHNHTRILRTVVMLGKLPLTSVHDPKLATNKRNVCFSLFQDIRVILSYQILQQGVPANLYTHEHLHVQNKSE